MFVAGTYRPQYRSQGIEAPDSTAGFGLTFGVTSSLNSGEYALLVSKKIPDVLMSRMIPHYERDLVPATIIFHHA